MWYNIWFNENENICCALDKFGTASFALDKISKHEHKQFVCINPLNGTRKDANVSSYRNILVESDCLDKEAQIKHMTDISLPYSTLTDSGGKSLHYVICLEESVAGESYYRQLARAVLKKVGDTADQKVFNPSRFSRLPNGIRKTESGPVVQKLIDCKTRIPNAELLQWLGDFKFTEYSKPAVQVKDLNYTTPFVKNLLMFGDMGQGRNNAIFRAACDLIRQGFDESAVISILESATDLDKAELIRTIQSAFQNSTK